MSKAFDENVFMIYEFYQKNKDNDLWKDTNWEFTMSNLFDAYHKINSDAARNESSYIKCKGEYTTVLGDIIEWKYPTEFSINKKSWKAGNL